MVVWPTFNHTLTVRRFVDIIPILINLIAFITGIRAVGEGHRWSFNKRDLMTGDKLAMVYLWIIGSTCFSLVHFVALLTGAPFIAGDLTSPVWLFLHSLIGIFFSITHVMIDVAFANHKVAEKVFGVSP